MVFSDFNNVSLHMNINLFLLQSFIILNFIGKSRESQKTRQIPPPAGRWTEYQLLQYKGFYWFKKKWGLPCDWPATVPIDVCKHCDVCRDRGKQGSDVISWRFSKQLTFVDWCYFRDKRENIALIHWKCIEFSDHAGFDSDVSTKGGKLG